MRILVLLFLGIAFSSHLGGETTWNQFRGPNGTGSLPHAKPPVAINRHEAAWTVKVPPGKSSPVLSKGRLFLTAIEDERLITLAFDKTSGQQLWRAEAPKVPLEKVHQAGSRAACSPCVDDERVIVYFGSYGLLCYDHNGKELWKKPIPTPKSLYGMSTSPVGYQDRVILVLDNDANQPDSKVSQSKVICLEKATGKLVWETPRPFVRSGWSTPAIVPHAGGDELVVLGSGRVCGYDAETGEEKWFVTGFSRETIALPVSGNGHVYVSASMLGGVADDQPDPEPYWKALEPFDTDRDGKIARAEMTGHFTFPFRPDLPLGHPGFGMPLPKDPDKRRKRVDGILKWVDKDGDQAWSREEFLNHLNFNRGKPHLMAIRPGGSGNVEATHVTWDLHRNIPEVPSPILYQNRLYLVRDGGVVSAVDAANGKVLYRKRLGAGGHYSVSPIIANEHLYFTSAEGVITVVPAGDTFQAVHQHDFEEPIAATPALDADTLYVRTESQLLAFRGK